MAPDAALLLLRGVPLRRCPRALRAAPALPRRHAAGLSTADELRPPATTAAVSIPRSPPAPVPAPAPGMSLPTSWEGHSEYRKWKVKEEEIMSDIEPITVLTKEILHSNRYKDGMRLSEEDEKAVIQKLLTYHPRSEDKIGCGLEYIMVDRHPQFRNSRCLFVVRTDGVWIDFSYQKCLRAYIRDKYPSHAERFIREHFKRS